MGVTILGGLVLLAGIVLLVLSILNLLAFYAVVDIDIAPDIDRTLFLGLSLVNFIVGIALVVAGNGLLGLRPWAWWLAFLVSLLAVIRSGFAFLSGIATATLTTLFSATVSVILGLAILGYIVSVRRHFR